MGGSGNKRENEDHKYHRINKMQKQENNILPEY